MVYDKDDDRDERGYRVALLLFRLGSALIVLGLISWLCAIWAPAGYLSDSLGATGALLVFPGGITMLICAGIMGWFEDL